MARDAGRGLQRGENRGRAKRAWEKEGLSWEQTWRGLCERRGLRQNGQGGEVTELGVGRYLKREKQHRRHDSGVEITLLFVIRS